MAVYCNFAVVDLYKVATYKCIDLQRYAVKSNKITSISVFIMEKNNGLVRDSNPGPLAPKARIIPLDH